MAPPSKSGKGRVAKAPTRLTTKSKVGVRRSSSNSAGKTLKLFDARRARSMLVNLFRFTKGQPFRPQVFRSWLRQTVAGKGFKLPSVVETEKLLATLSRNGRAGVDAGNQSAWQPLGLRYVDPEGPCSVDNLQGYERGPVRDTTRWVSWHEYGSLYGLHTTQDAKQRQLYQVVRNRALRRLSCDITRRKIVVPTSGKKKAQFNSVVLEPRRPGVGRVAPAFSFIYLHSFSATSTEYAAFPHYFGVSSAPIRVVLPTAPYQEQTCFEDWMVWRGKALKWRRVKFNSWFDYLTDKGGSGENRLCLKSLEEMRERVHALIREEVKRVGDPKRVIVGGNSQGCCVALDAALTFPEVLGGVIGCVGHVLGNTPLDPAKRQMPLHLFHEANDQEMKWRWIQGTVQRLVDAGFNVTSKREADPANCGHWIQEIEGQWVRAALRKIIHSQTAAAA